MGILDRGAEQPLEGYLNSVMPSTELGLSRGSALPKLFMEASMNKRKLTLKVEKIGGNKRITDKSGTIDIVQTIKKGERVPEISYWMAFQILNPRSPKLTFYRQLEDQGW